MSKISLDETGDVLYIIFADNSECYAEDMGDGIYGRYDINTDKMIGITITDFKHRLVLNTEVK